MSRKKEIQVGVTVIVSLGILIWGLLWFKQVSFSGTVHSYQVDFPSVGGLQSRDRVQVQGIRMGAVEDFEIVDGMVRVSFHVREETPLTEDAVVNLTSMGIVGEMLVEITQGTGPVAPDGHVFEGAVMKDMNAMMNEGAETLADARELTRELTAFMMQLKEGDRLERTLDGTAAAAVTLAETTEELAPDLKALVAELRETTQAVHGAVAGPDSLLSGTLEGAGVALARVDSLTTLLTRTTVTLAAVVERLEAGEGSAGRLLKDDSLYEEAEETILMVQDLIADIKARPKRYFHVELF